MTQIYAHRGASGYAPENTMAAFELAVRQGAQGIETDVHLTKDGKLVIIHDHILGRTIAGKGTVKDMTLEELQGYDCGSWFSRDFAGQRAAELKDLLSLVGKEGIGLNIEIKLGSPYYEGLEEKLVEELAHWNRDDQVILSSFNHYSLLKMEKLRPSLKRGFLTASFLIDSWKYVKENRGQAIHPHYSCVSKEMIDSCHKEGIQVNTYTVNGEAEARQLIEAGADCLITNYPDLMLKLAGS
ncbi:MAG: glycerophosphodiester phosphodiesterase [Spirochaetales bacterium]|nr:glycerophosphodiester phosphodiesterase [Spirochaetales bacterium]